MSQGFTVLPGGSEARDAALEASGWPREERRAMNLQLAVCLGEALARGFHLHELVVLLRPEVRAIPRLELAREFWDDDLGELATRALGWRVPSGGVLVWDASTDETGFSVIAGAAALLAATDPALPPAHHRTALPLVLAATERTIAS